MNGKVQNMESRQEITREERTRRILDAAAAEFAENGYARTTVRGIAARAGSSAAVINKYFDSKESLFRRVYETLPKEAFFVGRKDNSLQELLLCGLTELPCLKEKDPALFRLCALAVTDPDVPADCREDLKKAFERSETRVALVNAQKEGVLPAGEPFSLFRFYMKALCDFLLLRENMGLGKPDPVSIMRAVAPYRTGMPEYDGGQGAEESLRELLTVLTSDYVGLYTVDLQLRKGSVVTLSSANRGDVGADIARMGDLYTVMRAFIEKYVHPDDRGQFAGIFASDFLAKKLAHTKKYTVVFRRNFGGEYKYSEMVFTKFEAENEPPRRVLLGYQLVDSEIRERIEQRERMKHDLQIIDAFASEYAALYYVDLETQKMISYAMRPDVENVAGKTVRGGMPYSEAYRRFVEERVDPSDRERMLASGGIGYLMKELAHRKSFLTTYLNVDGRYCGMKAVKVGTEDELPRAVVLGFADRDADIRRGEEIERARRRNMQIIGILASEYSYLYYVDLTTDEMEAYTVNKTAEDEMGAAAHGARGYSEAFRTYVETFVHKDDREMMLRAGSVYHIADELSDRKTFSVIYRREMAGNIHWCEMKFVKMGDEDAEPTEVVQAFADRDEDIRRRGEQGG